MTVPAFALALGLFVGALPLLLPILVTSDLIRRTPLALTRAYLFATHYFACEVLGILSSLWLWLRYGWTRHHKEEIWLASHYRLQTWWASTLLAGARGLFGLKIEVDGDDAVPPGSGPFLLLVRHVSVGDTLLSAVYLAGRHGHRLRYVLKRELLWDPCLDIVGQRLPNCFVERGGQDSESEIGRVRALTRDLGPSEGVLIYPEGTRFTPEKRNAVLARLHESGRDDLLERARALENVLPPRPGGTLALLEERPDADVVTCVHAGFEGTMRLTDLTSGAIVGSTVRVHFDRIPADSIPRNREERIAWLFGVWASFDRWVARADADLARTPPGGATSSSI